MEKAAARFADERRGYLFVTGDATEDRVLEWAGMRTTWGLIVTTANNASNLYIVPSARSLKPTLRIVSRAADERRMAKLTRAGASTAPSARMRSAGTAGVPHPEPCRRRLLRDRALLRERDPGHRGPRHRRGRSVLRPSPGGSGRLSSHGRHRARHPAPGHARGESPIALRDPCGGASSRWVREIRSSAWRGWWRDRAARRGGACRKRDDREPVAGRAR